MFNKEIRKTTSLHPESGQAENANQINDSDNLHKTKLKYGSNIYVI